MELVKLKLVNIGLTPRQAAIAVESGYKKYQLCKTFNISEHTLRRELNQIYEILSITGIKATKRALLKAFINDLKQQLVEEDEQILLPIREARPAPQLNKYLTQQEREIVRHLVAGASAREIGEKMYISTKTVKWHLTRIYRKLNVKNKTHLMALFTTTRDINEELAGDLEEIRSMLHGIDEAVKQIKNVLKRYSSKKDII